MIITFDALDVLTYINSSVLILTYLYSCIEAAKSTSAVGLL